MRRAIARGRVFPQSYSTDRRYGRLSLKACALFPLMWANADDQGRLCGDPEEVKYVCCPNIDHVAKVDIPGLLKELQENKLIKIYETPKSSAIQILDWWDIQKPQWAWPSDYAPPDGWKDRLRYKKDAKTVVTQNWPSGESRDDTQVNEEKVSGNVESTAQVTTGENSSGEVRNPVQVNGEVPSGEDIEKAHPGAKYGSPENPDRTQVNTPVSEMVCKRVFARSGPLPSPDLSPLLETETEKETERGKRNSPESSGEREKGSQVRPQVAKKPPDPFAGDRETVFAGLKERRGYNSPVAGAEAKAITWMLRQGYMAEQVLGAYDRLKQDEFWRDKLLNMQSVKAQIGEICRERRQHEQRESRAGAGGRHTQPTTEPYEWQETPDEPDDTG